MNGISDWLKESSQIFWGEIAPCDKQLQDYDNDPEFVNALEQYVKEGLDKEEKVILIATKSHIGIIKKSLTKKGYNINLLLDTEQLHLVDVKETVKRFMVNGWPNDILFVEHIGKMIASVGKRNRVRIIGEMVATAWEHTSSGATLHLENLCRQFSRAENFHMVCAYPKSGFTQNATASVHFICKTHSRMLNDFENPYLHIA